MSNIKFSGNIGKEPELRYTPTGKPVLTFSVALYTGGNKDNPQSPVWVRVTAWEALATEFAEKLKKGDKVTVTGQPEKPYIKQGEDKPSGNLQVTASVISQGDEFREDRDER